MLSSPLSAAKERENLLQKLSNGSKLEVWSSSKQAWCLGTIESWRDEKEMNCSEARSHRFATVLFEGRRKEVQLDDPEQARPDPSRMKGVVYDLDKGEFRARYDIPIPEPAAGEVRVKVLAVGLNAIDASIGEWKDLIVPPRTIRVASSSSEVRALQPSASTLKPRHTNDREKRRRRRSPWCPASTCVAWSIRSARILPRNWPKERWCCTMAI